MGFVHRTVL